MAGVTRTGPTDDATCAVLRSAQVAVESLTPEKSTELANMLMSESDWRRKVREWGEVKESKEARLLDGSSWPAHGCREEVTIEAPDGATHAYRPRETCHIDASPVRGMSCSRCGKRWASYMVAFSYDPILGSRYVRATPRFCPNCGAENVDASGCEKRRGR